ncbi:MAG: helix-turn-helix transcriptional regulator [Spirochaetales bacterium]|jgi:HTH-type transcriptional regulator/antitoxin HipB|nr:helix-turn-helix transcriptional regulator [Spirochaetales bacterium]
MKTISSLLTPVDIEKLLASRLKTLRLMAGYKRATLAKRAGVSEGSLKRFETTGQVSLKNLLRLAYALDHLEAFSNLLIAPEATTLSALKAQSPNNIPKRGRF